MGTQKARESFLIRIRKLIRDTVNQGHEISEGKLISFIMKEGIVTKRTAFDYLEALKLEGFIESDLGLIKLK